MPNDHSPLPSNLTPKLFSPLSGVAPHTVEGIDSHQLDQQLITILTISKELC